MYLAYTLQKYSDCVPVAKGTKCNPLGKHAQNTFQLGNLTYLIVYESTMQAGSKIIYLITYFSVGQDCNLLRNQTAFICALNGTRSSRAVLCQGCIVERSFAIFWWESF